MTAMRTPLNFPPAMAEFAKLHGATFDSLRGGWGVDGDVPNELVRFVVRAARTRDYVADSVVKCVCGCLMVVRINRSTGKSFWGCSSARCHHTKLIDLDPVSAPTEVAGMLNDAARSIAFENRDRADAIYRRTVQEFGNPGAATQWLGATKVALRGCGETPLEAIKTAAGCAMVEKLLDERFGGS